MKYAQQIRLHYVALFVLMAWLSPAEAAITGFSSLADFSVNQSDAGTPPSYSAGVVHLTNSGIGQARSIFHKVPQSVTTFSAAFAYRAVGDYYSDGASFVLQNSPAGPNAVGGSHEQLGYGGITNSISIPLAFSGAPAGVPDNRTGLFTGGIVAGGTISTAPVDFQTGNWVNVSLNYDGSVLNVSLLDTVTLDNFSTNYIINIPSIVGGPTAYVGLTGSTNAGNNQYFRDLSFGAVPEPSTLAMLVIGAGAWALRLRNIGGVSRP